MVSSSAEERMDATAALCENLVESLFGGSGKFERDSPSFESMKVIICYNLRLIFSGNAFKW